MLIWKPRARTRLNAQRRFAVFRSTVSAPWRAGTTRLRPREDLFIVGIEVAMTDSMAYADVILPACTHFEHADVYPANGQQYLQRAEAVIPPLGESLPNTEIFRRLAAKFGFTDPAFKASDAELMDAALDRDDPRMPSIHPSQIPIDRAIRMEFGGAEPVLFQKRLAANAQWQNRAAIDHPWYTLRCGFADLPASGFTISTGADLACLRQAYHLDFRWPRGQ